MAITLDTITLPKDLVINNEFSDTNISADIIYSLGGKPMIFERELGGKIITLVGTRQTGWIDRSTLKQLQQLSNAIRTTYTLIFESDIYNVRFRHEARPVIQSSPIIPRPNHSDNDLYSNLVIKLMEV